jgi:arginine repressor
MEKETDEYCQKIFAYLVANNKEIRLNQLYKALEVLQVKITKPTLIQHLRHLHAKRYILRREKGKQNVTYQVNWKKFEPLNEALKFKEVIAHTLENEKIFKSKSLEQQIVYVTTILTWEQILHLQFNILNILEPKATFDITLGYVFIHRLYDT